MLFKIEREYGVMNCTLRGSTVILDILYEDGTRAKRYHRYKTLEKAEYMWNVYGANTHKIREEMKMDCPEDRCPLCWYQDVDALKVDGGDYCEEHQEEMR